jgi:hypothetical protein
LLFLLLLVNRTFSSLDLKERPTVTSLKHREPSNIRARMQNFKSEKVGLRPIKNNRSLISASKGTSTIRFAGINPWQN